MVSLYVLFNVWNVKYCRQAFARPSIFPATKLTSLPGPALTTLAPWASPTTPWDPQSFHQFTYAYTEDFDFF